MTPKLSHLTGLRKVALYRIAAKYSFFKIQNERNQGEKTVDLHPREFFSVSKIEVWSFCLDEEKLPGKSP